MPNRINSFLIPANEPRLFRIFTDSMSEFTVWTWLNIDIASAFTFFHIKKKQLSNTPNLFSPFFPVADPEFPRGEGANPSGVPTYNLAKFSQKLHEIKRIWTRRARVQTFTM